MEKDINIQTPLFSNDLSKKYIDFIHLCFVSFSGWEHKVEWNDDWIQFFDTNNVVEAIKMKESYNELLEYFKKDLSL